MTTRIAHISDPHFGREEPGLAAALLDHLNGGDYDLVIVSGDLTMAARTREFRDARAFIDALAPDVLAVPGNHDVTPYKLAERFLSPWKRWRRWISPTLEPEWRDERVVVLGVNTARRALLKLDWSGGSISRPQIRRIARRLRGVPEGVFRIVVAHHPFMADAALDAPTPLVARAAAALSAFAGGAVDVITSGHLHRTYTAAFEVDPRTGTRVAGAGADLGSTDRDRAAASRRLVVVQAGTALSARKRGEPNAFNRIDIADDGTLAVRRVTWRRGAWIPDTRPMTTLSRPVGHDARRTRAVPAA